MATKRKTKRPDQDTRAWTKPKGCAKKPRTLNAVWADAKCWIYPDPETEAPHRIIEVKVHAPLNAYKAAKLSLWLAEAAAWKEEE